MLARRKLLATVASVAITTCTGGAALAANMGLLSHIPVAGAATARKSTSPRTVVIDESAPTTQAPVRPAPAVHHVADVAPVTHDEPATEPGAAPEPTDPPEATDPTTPETTAPENESDGSDDGNETDEPSPPSTVSTPSTTEPTEVDQPDQPDQPDGSDHSGDTSSGTDD